MTRLAVAIAHAGDEKLLAPCLAALAKTPGIDEVAVTLPSDASESRALVESRGFRPVITDSLAPFAVATNLAVRATSAPYVLLLNDDTEVRPDAIAELVGPLKDRPQVGATAPRLVYPDLRFQPSIFDDLTIRSALEMLVLPVLSRWPASRLSRVPRRTFPTAPEPVEWVAAAALLVRRTLYDRLGGFDERYPHGIEDAAFCREARRLGYTILAVPSAEVIHHGSPSGLRSQDPRRLAATLTRGVRGWELYFRVYSPGSERWIRPIFALHAATRYVAFATMRWRGPATRNRAAAYREHARRMLSR